MTTAAELDIGPLTWVKGEIDLALEKALEALERHGDESSDSVHLQSARMHLHQAHGALSIVGLDGVTRFSEALEQLLEAVEDGEIAFGPNVAAAARQAIVAIRHFLDDLITGQPNQPLRLLPAYQALAEARGLAPPVPSELFFPDLSLRPPRREHEPEPLSADELRFHLKSSRAGFQRGLLKWLRENPRGIGEMRQALSAIEATQVQPSARAFWWSALGFLDALSVGTLPLDFTLRRLCARIDTQIKKLIEGSRTVAERLMRDTLYYVAVAGPAGDHAECVRAAYHLADLVPMPGTAGDIEPLRPLLRSIREQLSAAMEDWNRFCAGTAAALPQFHDRIRQVAMQVAELHHPDLARLATVIVSTADHLRKSPLSHNEAIALELATALLLMDTAIDGFQRLSGEFSEQVAVVADRVTAAQTGGPLTAMELPHLDQMSRRAQEKLLMSQVVKEILANLGAVEQSLDAFFRDQSKTAELAGLDKPIKQIEGTLAVLGQERALAVLRECETVIAGFSAEGYVPRHADFEEVASKLSALGFFVEQLQHGEADIDAILNPTALVATEEEEISSSIEAELEAARRHTRTLVGALRGLPEDEALRGEIKQSLEVLRENAQLVDDTALAEQANAAIVAIETDQAPTDIAHAVAQLAPVEMAPTSPSPEAARLVEASSEEIDAELLSIFIEEAHDVLATIGSLLPHLVGHPHDRDALTTIRRGFHTLKGSGRMVGLSALGETAWAVEQVLNRWLQQEQEATTPLLAMVELAHRLFADWVAQMEAGEGIYRDSSELVATCEALKSALPAAAPPPIPEIVEAAPETATEIVPPQVEPTAREEEPVEFAGEATEVADWKVKTEIASWDEKTEVADWEEKTEVAKWGAEPEPAAPSAPEAPLQLEVPPLVEAPAEPLVEPVVESVPETAPPQAPPVETPAEPEPAVTPPPRAEPVLRLVPPVQESIQVGQLVLSPTLFDLYVNEAQGHIVTLNHELSLAGPPRHALIRAAHTLAGISATTGFEAVNHLAHALENALGRLGAASVGPTENQQLLLARAVGALEGMVGAIASRRLPQNEEALARDLDTLNVEVPVLDAILAEAPKAAEPEPGSIEPQAEPVMPAPTEAEADRRHMRLQDELDPQLLPIFLEEAVDLMRDIGAELREWREHPNDTRVADKLKRSLHTFKGSARMAGAMGLGELIHSMESRVEQAFAANAVTPAFLDSLDGSFDRASVLMEALQTGEAPEAEEAPAAEVPAAPMPAAKAAPIPAVAAPAAPVDIRPDLPEVEATARAMLRVRADIVDKLVNEAGEIAIARGRIEGEMRSLKASLLDLTENVIRLRNQLREVEIQAESQMQSRQALAAEQELHFDPLEFDRFTRFQELTRMMAESVNDVATSQHALLQNLDHADAAITAQARLNRELSQALMGVRMVPFNTLADRLYRIVRQTAKEMGKRANLDIRGGQTELDRSVLEKMTGPLEHLLRNAIAHGLERPEQRAAAGKAEIGEIALRVGQEGNEIVIELTDDGGGLDYERIRAKAMDHGLLRADEPAGTEQLTQLIFQPGFSTADELTAVSGRGVGMDVVKSEAASLGGRIEVDSTSGQGTRFRVYLPLTLAVTQALLVRAGNRHYAIPSSMVAQVSEMKEEAIAAIRAEGASTWLGDRYPWHYLPHLLGDTAAQPAPARRYWLLLLRAGTQHVAVEVDGMLGNQELVVKNIGPQLARVVGISGATVLGTGEIALILNPIALSGRAVQVTTAPGAPVVAEVKAPALSAAGVVMVVDDSLTVRKITGRLLAREGYHVLTAKDGVDALEQLIDVKPDVMLVDIEMPRMDGFDLTRNVRADERLRSIPIVMITSRIGDKHRNYAREIGVNHYLGKPYDEEELLRLISKYTGHRQG
jgi:chemosensory pili system protein ChpA (sensor histidine kinase/response regulator)